MTALPSIASFTAPTVTEGEFKTALSNLHLFLSGLLGTTGAAADAQAALGALLGAGVTTKTGAYTVAAADRGRVIACSGTFTVTLPDAGAVDAGFAVAIANYGTGTVTVDPFSTQTLDGASTRTLAASRMMVVCAVNGEWLSVGGIGAASTTEAGVVQLSTATNSTSTTLAATPSAVKAAYDLAASKADASHTHSQYLGTDIGHNVVGSLCLATWLVTGTGTVNPGNTVAGSALRAANLYSSHATALSGTWRCLGYAVSDGSGGHSILTTLWQRIS
jgi:phage-related tail fiber protein